MAARPEADACALAISDPAVARTIASIVRSPIATTVTLSTLPDNPLIAVNEAFCRLTGYSEDEVIGRNCRLLGGPGTEPDARSRLRQAIADEAPAMVEITNYRKDGSAFCNAVMIAPLRNSVGEVVAFVGSQMDVGPAPSSLEARSEGAQGLVAALSPRQGQVLSLIADGRLNKEIAATLGISLPTVKLHRSLMLERLGVRTTAEAIRIAVEAGLPAGQSATSANTP